MDFSIPSGKSSGAERSGVAKLGTGELRAESSDWRKVEGVKRILIVAGSVLCLIYAGDYVSVRFRISKGRDPFGTVQVQKYYSVMKKDGEPDFYFNPPQDQVCVRSLFPHLGYTPCWYLNRHKTQKISV